MNKWQFFKQIKLIKKSIKVQSRVYVDSIRPEQTNKKHNEYCALIFLNCSKRWCYVRKYSRTHQNKCHHALTVYSFSLLYTIFFLLGIRVYKCVRRCILYILTDFKMKSWIVWCFFFFFIIFILQYLISVNTHKLCNNYV